MSKETYWPDGRAPAPNPSAVIGTKCCTCGRELVAQNLSVLTDKAGACRYCVPLGPASTPPAMFNTPPGA